MGFKKVYGTFIYVKIIDRKAAREIKIAIFVTLVRKSKYITGGVQSVSVIKQDLIMNQ